MTILLQMPVDDVSDAISDDGDGIMLSLSVMMTMIPGILLNFTKTNLLRCYYIQTSHQNH